jgi:hypothetical protein
MPMVGKKEFGYSKEEKKAAKDYAKKTGMEMKVRKIMKKDSTKKTKGY